MPYDGFFKSSEDCITYIREMLENPASGLEMPAALVFETIQGEGGLGNCSVEWTRGLFELAQKHGILTIVDDIQAGCGRSGHFFSFEDLAIVPDIVVIAKAISGYGLPMSLVLLHPELDVWEPGEHNGTFRGNNLAFVTASEALNLFWTDDEFAKSVRDTADGLRVKLNDLALEFGWTVKGKGMMIGIDVNDSEVSAKIRWKCFENGLIVEGCGPYGEVIKLLPPLNILAEELEEGIQILENAFSEASEKKPQIIC